MAGNIANILVSLQNCSLELINVPMLNMHEI